MTPNSANQRSERRLTVHELLQVANQVRCDRLIASLSVFRLANRGGARDVDCHRPPNFDASRFHIDILYLQCDNFAWTESSKDRYSTIIASESSPLSAKAAATSRSTSG